MQKELRSVTEALGKTKDRVLELLDLNPTPIVLIDGRAGSGKSTFARNLVDELFREGESAPRLIAMDDLYPGWDGLRSGSNYLNHQILEKLARAETAHYQIWNWETSSRGNPAEPGNGWREFSGGTPLIVEGCGSLSRVSKELAQVSIWMECETKTRKERWQSRDGNRFDQYWGVWAAQEDEFYEAEKSKELADFLVFS